MASFDKLCNHHSRSPRLLALILAAQLTNWQSNPSSSYSNLYFHLLPNRVKLGLELGYFFYLTAQLTAAIIHIIHAHIEILLSQYCCLIAKLALYTASFFVCMIHHVPSGGPRMQCISIPLWHLPFTVKRGQRDRSVTAGWRVQWQLGESQSLMFWIQQKPSQRLCLLFIERILNKTEEKQIRLPNYGCKTLHNLFYRDRVMCL